MTDPLRVNATETFNIAHAVANHAEELRDELRQLVREWENLSHGWEGVAASAYRPAWDEWHEGAARIVEVLADESDKLARAAAAYDEQDSTAAQALDARNLGL
jgi:WXG100 family type VII secretion target